MWLLFIKLSTIAVPWADVEICLYAALLVFHSSFLKLLIGVDKYKLTLQNPLSVCLQWAAEARSDFCSQPDFNQLVSGEERM